MDTDPPAKPPLSDIAAENMVCVDVGILKYTHDTDGTAVKSLGLADERHRPEQEQRKLSRKAYGSNNWENQRQRVAKCHLRIKGKRRNFLHKFSNHYAREYELAAVEDIDVKGMLESPSNSRNTASAAWNMFTSMLEYKCEHEGTHFVEVEPEGTTKECASCGVETDKPLWVREHSCPTCGFEADRDANAVVKLRLTGSKIEERFCDGMEHSFSRSGDTRSGSLRRHACGDCAPCGNHGGSCKARSPDYVWRAVRLCESDNVVEPGSPCLKGPPTAASRQG